MILQKIQLPQSDLFNSELRNLYMRSTGDVECSEEKMTLDRNAELIFNTYYNSFSFSKWAKYTWLDNMFLSLKIKGRFELTFLQLELKNDKAVETKFSKVTIEELNSRIPMHVKIKIPIKSNFKGSYGFIIQAVEKDSVFCGGYYGTDIDNEDLNVINLALGICHFKREEYVVHNVTELSDNILNNKNSSLNGHLKVFISDNSRTLDNYLISSEIKKDIKILPNKNTGGAGGFSRAIYEATHSSENFTHMILMDDDVVFTYHTLERLYSFLRLMKPNYLKSSVIGGAMLLADCPFIQYGNGETWSVGGMIFNKTNYNLYSVRDILRNEVEEGTNQLPWWFYCFPFNERTTDMYALPLFFQYDDIDFNQRFKDLHQITVNGISLLHESFEGKYSLSKEYYAIRNRLIICSIHGGDNFSKDFIIKLLSDVVKMNVLLYRYKSAMLAIRAVKDFFKGLDWLAKQDPDELNKEISASLYKIEPADNSETAYLDQQYEQSLVFSESKLKRNFRRLTLNGAVFPTRKTAVIPMIHYKAIKAKLFRVKTAINYDPKAKRKFITKRCNFEAFKTMVSYKKTVSLINKKFDDIVSDYKEKYNNYITGEFWKEYLGL